MMRRREFLGGASAALIVPNRNLFIAKAPAIVRGNVIFNHRARAATLDDAMTRFLATLSNDEWGQPAHTAARSVFYANDTAAPDYNKTTAIDNNGTTGANAMWTIWSGGAHDTKLNRALIGPGGLHFAYCGNEIYAFDFATLRWSRIRRPDDIVVETSVACTAYLGHPSYSNGDPPPAHLYSSTVYLDWVGPHGTLWCGYGDFLHSYMLDLSKAAPYQPLSLQSLGVPGSGWKMTSGPTGFTTPTISVPDPTSNRVYIANQQIGGGPPNLLYYDIGTDTFSTSGLISGFPGLPQLSGYGSYFTGTLRKGHREMWGFGGPNDANVSAMCVALTDGTYSFWNLKNVHVVRTPIGYPGVCYIPPIDKLLIWSGGNGLILVDCVTKTDTVYATTGTIPARNGGGGNAGAMTKMFCDTVHRCIVLCYDGNSDVYVLKTSLF